MKTEINQNDVKIITCSCKEKLDLANQQLGKEYNYASLPLAIIDAVFSIQANYNSVINVVAAYCENYDLPIEKSSNTPVHTVSDLIRNIEAVGGSEKFAQDVLKNKTQTAGAHSILKAEAVYQWAKVLRELHIETFADYDSADKQVLEKELKKIQGQGEAVVRYFFMLCGNDNFVKPDRWILRFLSSVLNRDIKEAEAEKLLEAVAADLRQDYPDMTARLLDNIIWKYQRSLSDK